MRGFSFPFYLFPPVEEFSEAAGGRAGGRDRRVGGEEYEAVIGTLSFLSLSLSLSCVCVLFS